MASCTRYIYMSAILPPTRTSDTTSFVCCNIFLSVVYEKQFVRVSVATLNNELSNCTRGCSTQNTCSSDCSSSRSRISCMQFDRGGACYCFYDVSNAKNIQNVTNFYRVSSVFSYRCVTICCLLYTSPSPRDYAASRMPSSA